MSDWRPYEPSLEAERSAVIERAKLRAIGGIVVTRDELRAHPLDLRGQRALACADAYRSYKAAR